MRLSHLTAARFLFVGLLLCTAHGVARAQDESAASPEPPKRTAAEKIDEYGKIGHCDWTARLDNLAIELQSDPGLRGLLVGYDAGRGRDGYAAQRIMVERRYLVDSRGILPERVTVVYAGRKEGAETPVTELWLLPEGATPPVPVPDAAPGGHEVSGKLGVYRTDENTFREMIEMGVSYSDVMLSELAEKLKQQPGSEGHVVVFTPKGSAPGAWRRIARRDEVLLQKDHGIEPGRLKFVNGGRSDGESAEVEVWVAPKGAPPPVAASREEGEKPAGAYRLNALDFYGTPDADADQWVLESIAEVLRENPRARVYLVAREPAGPVGNPGEETAADSTEQQPEQPEPEPAPTPQAGDGRNAEGNEAEAEEEEPEEEEIPTVELAGRWKAALAEKYGVAADRVVVVQGRERHWSVGRLLTWVVPDKVQPPDFLAPDEEDRQVEEAERKAEQRALLEAQGNAELAPAPPGR